MNTAVTRRDLLKGAALGAAATAVAAGTTAAVAAPSRAKGDVTWDAEYDVVVLGLGGAGANAAVAAYE